MAQITLTDEEAGRLKEILGSLLSDLRMEIADTDRKEYRDELKNDEDFIRAITEKL